ncbi:MAG: hypothetical protein J5836_00190 [Clostridia bacterium]|nr:hypothetical protein [Clostridia bacterium]
MKLPKSKFIAVALIGLAFLYFTNDFGLIDIEKTAIVVALGIDYNETKSDYTVTAQIATPESSSEMTVKNQKRTVNGYGGTIAEAIENIGISTGWYPMLSFCELLLLGKDVLKGNVMDVISYFLRSDNVPDSAILASCEKTAEEVLNSTPVLEDVTALAIEKIISDTQKSKLIAITNVKTFSQGYYSISGSSYMPMLKAAKDPEGANLNEGKENDKERFLYDATTTCVFQGGIHAFDLSPNETLAYNLYKKGTTGILVAVENAKFAEKVCNALFSVRKIKTGEKLIINKTAKYTINIEASFAIEDADVVMDASKLTPVDIIPTEVLKQIEENLSSSLNSIFIKCINHDCDLFKIKENLFKYHYEYYEEYKDDILNEVSFETNIKCRSYAEKQKLFS